jgi:hypothetical protein
MGIIMKLRTVTLLAAITQLLVLICSIYNYVHMVFRLKWADNAEYFLLQPVYCIAQFMLTVFFFVLFARQKSQ